jgi:tRNA-splicing ligase RtcB
MAIAIDGEEPTLEMEWSKSHPTVRQVLGGRHIKSWATQVEPGAVAQAENLARLPFALNHIALMPDAHQGYGMPIGGVLFADRVVVPYAIGVDIGCGVVLNRLHCDSEALIAAMDEIGPAILEAVPVGVGPQGEHPRGAQPVGPAALKAEENDFWMKPEWISRARGQLGTLGSGNHFMEFQVDEDGNAYLMIHSGSRGLGKAICDTFHKKALEMNRRWYSDLPDKELAYLPFDTDEGQGYWQAMHVALRFAEANRQHMIDRIIQVVAKHIDLEEVTGVVDCHHNYAAFENHFGKNGIVHRKGAVRARAGEDVLIPGSMGVASYWARGLGNRESFETCQHGAGRAMSRAAAKKAFTADGMRHELSEAGTRVYAPDTNDVVDEAPGAYKPIEEVMAASTDLVEIVERLTPIGTVKG